MTPTRQLKWKPSNDRGAVNVDATTVLICILLVVVIVYVVQHLN